MRPVPPTPSGTPGQCLDLSRRVTRPVPLRSHILLHSTPIYHFTIGVGYMTKDEYIDIVGNSYEELQDVRLEVLPEILGEPGYGGNIWFFKKHNEAMEIIDPAIQLVFATGEADPSYFIEICEQVNASQLEE